MVPVPKFSKQLDCSIPAMTVVSERSALNPMLKSDLVISRGVTIDFFILASYHRTSDKKELRDEIEKDNDIVNLEELASGTSFEFMSRGFHSGDAQQMDQSLIDSLVGFQDDLTNLGLFASWNQLDLF